VCAHLAMGLVWHGSNIDCLQSTPRAVVHKPSLQNDYAVLGACLLFAPDLAHSQDAHHGHKIVLRRQAHIECSATLHVDGSGFGVICRCQGVEHHEVVVHCEDCGTLELALGTGVDNFTDLGETGVVK
jgi:hypothetical protein